MPKRGSPEQRRIAYDMVKTFEGEMCICCFVESGQQRGPRSVKLELDHVRLDIANIWEPGNVHLTCNHHNLWLRSLSVEQHSSVMATYSAIVEREREKKNLPTWKTYRKQSCDYEHGSSEMKANAKFEPAWLVRANELVSANHTIDKGDLIAECAHYCDCSINTSRNYLIKHTAHTGLFMELKMNGARAIMYRDPDFKPLRKRPAHLVAELLKTMPPGALNGNGNGHKALGSTVPVEAKR